MKYLGGGEVTRPQGARFLGRSRGLPIGILMFCKCDFDVVFQIISGLMLPGPRLSATALSPIILLTCNKIIILGVINVLITTPLWVANTRMKLQGVNLKSEELSRKVQYKYTGLIGT